MSYETTVGTFQLLNKGGGKREIRCKFDLPIFDAARLWMRIKLAAVD